ncbi:MAG TPA: hypothetical protein VGV93_05805 [Acidimicrobiales bacterium]|nr:hypothetical protein [Acidimicrobiales bacterium]
MGVVHHAQDATSRRRRDYGDVEAPADLPPEEVTDTTPGDIAEGQDQDPPAG